MDNNIILETVNDSDFGDPSLWWRYMFMPYEGDVKAIETEQGTVYHYSCIFPEHVTPDHTGEES